MATDHDEYKSGKTFDDSVHGPITLHPLLEHIVNTPHIQRLRNIKQLGGLYCDYIGAERSRFQHSIGMCHLSGIFLEILQRRQPNLPITKRDVLCIQIAALCRNLGQGPFSRLFDELVLPKIQVSTKPWKFPDSCIAMFRHLLQSTDLKAKFEDYGLILDEDISFIEELIIGSPNKDRPANKRFLYEIVNNKQYGIDVNRMDYIARDSQELCYFHNFDWRQYMNSVRVITTDDGISHICCREDEIHLVHEFYHVRVHMFYNYYHHWKSRANENMIADALVKANEYIIIPGEHGLPRKLSEVVDDMYAFTKLTDSVIELIRMDPREVELKESKELLSAIQKNWIHQYIGCIKNVPVHIGTALAESISQRLVDIYGNIETESDVILQTNHILVDKIYFDLGSEKHDPMINIWVYSPDSLNVAMRAKEGIPPVEYAVPNMFYWAEIRIYSRWDNPSEITKAIKRGFEQFLKVENYDGSIYDVTSKKVDTTKPIAPVKKQDRGSDWSHQPAAIKLMLDGKNRDIERLHTVEEELRAQVLDLKVKLQNKANESEEEKQRRNTDIEFLKKMSKGKDVEIERIKRDLEEKKLAVMKLQKQLRVQSSKEISPAKSLTETQQKSSKQSVELNLFNILSTLFFIVLVCCSHMSLDKFPSSLQGVSVIASTQLMVLGGQANQLHWEDYGLIINIPSNALPKGFLAKLVVRVSVSGPFLYSRSSSWKPSSAVYWISSSRDFEEPVLISVWHTVRNFHNNSLLRFVSSQNDPVNGKYLLHVIDGGSFDNTYGHISVTHFSPFQIQSGNQTEERYKGCLFYRILRRSLKSHQRGYSFLIYNDLPPGLLEIVLAEYTGWHKGLQVTVEFDKDYISLELNGTVNINGWSLKLKYDPAKYKKNDLCNYFASIVSNMQFTVKRTHEDAPSYFNTILALSGSERPKTIDIEIDAGIDNEEATFNPGALGIINSINDIQPWLEHITSSLDYSICLNMGKVESDKAKMEQIFVKDRIYQITDDWLNMDKSCTWKSFTRVFVCMGKCQIAKEISKEKFIYFLKQEDADVLKKCPDLPTD